MNFAIKTDPQSSQPLYRQVYEELRQAILTGRLKPGARLPSSRTLAESLGVSRITITQSFELLISEGYLEAVTGSGTFVCSQLPDDLVRPLPVHTRNQPARQRQSSIRLSEFGERLARINPFQFAESEAIINFKNGMPALDEFPLELWRRLVLRHLRSGEFELLDYASGAVGYQPLREALADYLARSRAVRCTPDQIVIVNGSQQALALISQLLLDPGDTVAVEDPGYLGARRAFESQGARLLGVNVDEAGIVVEQLAQRKAASIRLIYVTPSHQFPTGAVMSLQRRLALLNLVERSGALIIEDDYDSEFRFDSRPIPALQGLTENNSVLYVGTFSKLLFPALRIGYLVLPPSLVSVFARAKWLADRQTPVLEQKVLTDFLTEGHLDRHLRRMRVIYQKRRLTLIRSLQQSFGGRVTIQGDDAGLHLMARFQTKLSDTEITRRAARVGVGVTSARHNYLTAADTTEFVFGFGGLSERKIREGIKRLSSVMD